jgi:hypothetical protein
MVMKLEQNIEEGLKILGELVKKEKFCEWNEGRVVCAVLSLLSCNQDHHKTNNSM